MERLTYDFIPARSSPGLPRTAPSAAHQGREGEKCATDGARPKLRNRKDFVIGTWNIRTLNAKGKLKELTHEMERYRWNILGLSEVRWKKIGEASTDEGHKIYFSGREDKHEQGVGFLVHKNTVNCVMGCRPVSSRLITIRLKATPFNITIIQVYAPTSDYDDNQVEEFYNQLQEVLDERPKNDILIVMGDWNAKVELARHLWTILQHKNK
eukprot:TRINITY_DN21504_c0_g3_i3.p1 TRINITY_DN21504_c0_g3~~TRINITY_DN21504_c0_g3_i3.p1  ORF type:complete len:211 (-),score=34.41 TRINITY_DN21504_c0_g3_i3:29-661(-)